MLFTRFNPFGASAWDQMQRMQHEMNRLFGNLPGDGNVTTFPAVNVREEDEALHVEAELPGMSLEEVEIFVTGNNQLTLKGERKAPATRQGNSTSPGAVLWQIRAYVDFAFSGRRQQSRGTIGKRHLDDSSAETRSRAATQNRCER